MIKNTHIAALLLMILTIAGACTKPAEEAKTIHDTLRNGKWRQTSGTVRFQGQNGVDTTGNYFDNVPACIKDDYIVFKDNFGGVVEDADSTCGIGDPRERPFTWEVMKAESKLNIFNARRNFQTSSVYGEIVSISDGNLSIRYTVYEQFTPGDIDTLTYTNEYSK